MSAQIDGADPRTARKVAEPLDETQMLERGPEFRVDLERIRFSPYFSRMSAVTQVISQSGAGLAVHNRLTHTVKVTAVARAIAVSLAADQGERGRIVSRLGGCDPVVVQAAASAHDLGHPPFGHLGEQALDRLARERFGLAEGFEGNAQSFRTLTRLDEYDRAGAGLNLTAAVRAAVLKYPWERAEGDEWTGALDRPRGLTPRTPGEGAAKFSTYSLDADDFQEARDAYPAIARHQQTIECSVMDIADDIAYSLHDLDDFYRASLLGHAAVSAEFRTWRADRAALATMPADALLARPRTPGHALETLRRRLRAKDAWIADDDAFGESVARVQSDVVDGLLAVPFDGSLEADRALAVFMSGWVSRLQRSIVVMADPPVRSGHISLDTAAWHDVAVLKFLQERFVLHRPDLAVYQRGQANVMETLVGALAEWLDDPHDVRRAPRRLLDLVELAAEDYRDAALRDPDGDGGFERRELRRLATGRGIVDYVASLTDVQAMSLAGLVSGASERLWDAGQGL
ncbi:deoxyguanosinetriphosphate triphosphohydrolase family protein [Demequina zhanjiangensis]|uniref:DNTP triphosphohydrolase n=1 Tax=Demequina zhanjiangensis TaxID=3051659 RepID=A0ABT8G0U3_9MICO|nr:dNTP triphosphohydrolase [Demequina sp. SYSU T00b26]MDN4472755.1 dNTP triphosphohydrolase [Demequina sp. SYSU T00b26]